MSSKDIGLGQISLSNLADADKGKVQLLVASSITIAKVPGKLAALPDTCHFTRALVSGAVWICRGARCRIVVRVSLNGQVADRPLLDRIGFQLQDSHVGTGIICSASAPFRHFSLT